MRRLASALVFWTVAVAPAAAQAGSSDAGDARVPVEIRKAADPPSAAPRATAPSNRLAGAWSGQWVDPRDGRSRPAELIIIAGRQPSTVVAQLTLLGGARAWTARYEGIAREDGAEFQLPEGGAIEVSRTGDDRLTGEFTAPGGTLPAPAGSLELSRIR